MFVPRRQSSHFENHYHREKPQALRRVLRPHRVNAPWVSQVCREQPSDSGACESHLMAGFMFTTCFGHFEKSYEVMKLNSHMPWPDVLNLFNIGSKPHTQDIKKDISKTEVEKQEILQKLGHDTETTNGLPNQTKGSLPISPEGHDEETITEWWCCSSRSE